MSYNFIANFPYPEIRQIQKEALLELEKHWDDYSVFVINAPTAFGKSSFAKAIMNTIRSTSLITPTNLLVDQFRAEFPNTCSLARLDSYTCDEWKRPCPVTKGKLMNFCSGCPAGRDLATAKYQRGAGVYNYYTFLAHKLHRDVLVVDEAHNLLPTIRDRLTLQLWKHDLKYPEGMWNPEQTLRWIKTLSAKRQAGKKIAALKEASYYEVPKYIAHRTMEWFNGKGTLRNEPEQRDVIKLEPVDISDAPPMFWPKEVKKVVLMSATIGPKDIEQLGLGGRRVIYIDCKSPIPGGNRPIVLENVTAVNRKSMAEAIPLLVEYIQNKANEHPQEKGVVHATYALARALQEHLTDNRFMFHDKYNKKEQYMKFRESVPRDGRILVASGMYEGIDLPQDLGRWQVIAKIPWTSLGSPAIRHLADLDPEWYYWECVKTLIQACGRICRTPTDFGVTYIPDTTINRLFEKAGYMLPSWFKDAIIQ